MVITVTVREMLEAEELLEEYMEHYQCGQDEAIEMILEDMNDAKEALIKKRDEPKKEDKE